MTTRQEQKIENQLSKLHMESTFSSDFENIKLTLKWGFKMIKENEITIEQLKEKLTDRRNRCSHVCPVFYQ